MSDVQRPGLTPGQIATIERLNKTADEVKAFSVPPSGGQLDLDSELEQIASQVEEQLGETEPEAEEALPLQLEIKRDILQLLAERDDAPSDDQILAWKDEFGEAAVQLLGLDKDNVYIYTHLTLAQWEKIQGIIKKVQNTPMAENVEKMIQQNVIRTAVLWPVLNKDFFKKCRAGLPDTIYQLILIHSYFLSPQQAMTLTTQL